MSDVTAVESFVVSHKKLKQEIAKIIVGQDEVVDQILLSIFSGGHALLIGVPGLAKTLMVNTIAKLWAWTLKGSSLLPTLCQAIY